MDGTLHTIIGAISTHTSLAGRDIHVPGITVSGIISTHTSLAGRDYNEPREESNESGFLLTRPSRDVTHYS